MSAGNLPSFPTPKKQRGVKKGHRDEDMFRLLEQLLSLSHRDNDGPAIVSSLRDCFESPLSLFASSRQLLESIGLRPCDALLLSQMTDLARCCQTGTFPRQPKLDKIYPAAKYLCAHFYCLQLERFYALCLDGSGRMLELLYLQEGTEDSALLSMRRLLREVMRVRPAAVVLSHNHPGGTLSPSQEDIDCTRAAMRALSGIGVPVLDHLILVRGTAVSLRANGFIPEICWLKQSNGCSLLRSWLEGADLKQAVLDDLLSPAPDLK